MKRLKKVPVVGWSKPLIRLIALVATLLAVSVCGDDDLVPGAATVAVSGAHGLRIGESVTLVATSIDGADSAYRWASSRNDVATVDGAGTVTGVATGETIITATGADTGASANHAIVVMPVPLETVVVSVEGNPFVQVGATVLLSATTIGAQDSAYTWTSSDEAIATVATDGTVTGRSPGQATITATGVDTAASDALIVTAQNEIPHYDEWLGSAHADITAEPFNHWNTEDPPEIPTTCARCHSTPGYRDYLGADGSTPEIVDNAAPIGTVIECQACHNDAANALEQVTFPSGEIVDRLGAEARCMVCHQGRSSSDDVDAAITTAAVTTDDEPSTNLSFLNIHNYAAGATLNAGRVRGGYQYTGNVYDWRFRHVPDFDTCIECHNPHSLEVRVTECAKCHANISTKDDLKNIRMLASLGQDYDGDGDLVEGMYHELQGLRTLLLTAIESYTTEQTLGDICYDADAYPYWFKDSNGNGTCQSDESTYDNRWAPFTARLLRATYNYQVSSKDPGAFAHNSKYIIQLLYDSIADLNQALTGPVDLSSAVRNDFGHFNGASEAARHWDEDETVSASCSKCHGGSEGFRFFVKYGIGTPVVEPDNGLDCATCHDNFTPTFDVVKVDAVTYPSGITITDPGQISNVCSTCHSGRESKKTIDDAIAANKLGFRNVHYLPAAAVKKGGEAKVGYEYPNKTYAGEWTTHGRCVDCHDPVATNHTFHPLDNPACSMGCHSPTPIKNIRTNHTLDYDGDASTTEPLEDEIATVAQALLLRMGAVSGTPPLCYSATSYPYFFKDTNANGACDGLETASSNGFKAWTAALMKAAHNYQISQKEHGAWAHNFDYMMQLLYDSIQDLGGDTSSFIRP